MKIFFAFSKFSVNPCIKIDFFDILGKNIFSKKLTYPYKKIDISKFKSGVYTIQIKSLSSNKIIYKKVIKS